MDPLSHLKRLMSLVSYIRKCLCCLCLTPRLGRNRKFFIGGAKVPKFLLRYNFLCQPNYSDITMECRLYCSIIQNRRERPLTSLVSVAILAWLPRVQTLHTPFPTCVGLFLTCAGCLFICMRAPSYVLARLTELPKKTFHNMILYKCCKL